MVKEEEATARVMSTGGVVGGVPGGVPGGQMGGVVGGIISSTPLAVPKVATPQRGRVSSGVSSGFLLRNGQPVYPSLARLAGIPCKALFQARVCKAASIENLHIISGPPMLPHD